MSDLADVPDDTRRISDKLVLDAIQTLLSGKHWEGDTIERIAETVRFSGRPIHEVRDWEVTVSLTFVIEGHDEETVIKEAVNMAKDVQHNDYAVQVSRFSPQGKQHQPEQADDEGD